MTKKFSDFRKTDLVEKAPKMRTSTNPVEMIVSDIKKALFGYKIKEKDGKFTIEGFPNGGKVKITVSGDKRDINPDEFDF